MSGATRTTGSRRVVITGCGLLTPLGDSPAAVHAALCEGRGCPAADAAPADDWAERGLPPVPRASLGDLDVAGYLGPGNLRPLDRTARLAASAAALALADGGWGEAERGGAELGLVLGTMFGSVRTITEFDCRAVVDGPSYAKPMHFANTVINAAAGQTAIWHGLRGTNATISGGSSSGLQALGYAVDLIRHGRATALLAGGAEELCYETAWAFYRAGRLALPDNGAPPVPVPLHPRRNGFALGEAAAMLMLEEAESAAARGARILAEIDGCGDGFDGSRGADPRSSRRAVERAVRLALAAAGAGAAEIDAVSLSANGSPEGDRLEAEGLAAVWNGGAHALPVTAVKSMLGESLGAAGALQTALLLEAMRDGTLPGIAGLDEIEDELPLRAAAAGRRALDIRRGLVTALEPGGKSCAVSVRRWAA